MGTRPYLVVSGLIFGVVAALHLLRVVNQWAFQVGPWSLPLSVSWLGTLVPALLCVWAFRLASKSLE
jgi:hypothetical protein